MSLLHDTTSQWRDAHLAIKSVVRAGIDFEIGSEEKGGARTCHPPVYATIARGGVSRYFLPMGSPIGTRNLSRLTYRLPSGATPLPPTASTEITFDFSSFF